MKRKSHLIYLLTVIMMLPVGVQAKNEKTAKKSLPLTEIQTTAVVKLQATRT